MSKMIKTSRFGGFFLFKKALSWPRKVVYKITVHILYAKIILIGWNISPVYGKEKGKYSPDKGWIYEYNIWLAVANILSTLHYITSEMLLIDTKSISMAWEIPYEKCTKNQIYGGYINKLIRVTMKMFHDRETYKSLICFKFPP